MEMEMEMERLASSSIACVKTGRWLGEWESPRPSTSLERAG